MKYFKKIACVLLTAATVLTGCSIGGREIVMDINSSGGHTLLVIDKKKCNITEAKLYLANYKNLYGDVYGVNLYKTKDASKVEKYVKDVTVDELARVYCMVAIAGEKKIALTDKEKKAVSEAAKEYYKSLSDAERDFIGASQADVEEAYDNYAIAKKLYNSLAKGVDTEVSDDDARVMHIQKIFVKEVDKAEAVKEKLASGEDFATVAGTTNEDNQTDVYVDKGTLADEVEAVAFELNDGQVSDMIKTDDGYYFIKCISKLDEEKTEKNKEIILQQREQEQFNDDYNRFVKNADFELNSQLWDSIDIKGENDLKTNSFFTIYNKYFEADDKQ